MDTGILSSLGNLVYQMLKILVLIGIDFFFQKYVKYSRKIKGGKNLIKYSAGLAKRKIQRESI